MKDLKRRVEAAVRHFWTTRQAQETKQGAKTGRRDQGSRSAVTGGAQLDGFIRLVSELLVESGIPDATIFRKKSTELPGFFRPTKEWDLLVVVDGHLLASIEFKSQIGPSFGNNYKTEPKRPWAAQRTFGPRIGKACSAGRHAPGWVISCYWKRRLDPPRRWKSPSHISACGKSSGAHRTRSDTSYSVRSWFESDSTTPLAS